MWKVYNVHINNRHIVHVYTPGEIYIIYHYLYVYTKMYIIIYMYIQKCISLFICIIIQKCIS